MNRFPPTWAPPEKDSCFRNFPLASICSFHLTVQHHPFHLGKGNLRVFVMPTYALATRNT